MLLYAAPVYFSLVFSSHLDKLEVVQYKALIITTGYHLKAVMSHLRGQTRVLFLRTHLELYSFQHYTSELIPPSHLLVTSHPRSLTIRGNCVVHILENPSLPKSPRWQPKASPVIFGGVMLLSHGRFWCDFSFISSWRWWALVLCSMVSKAKHSSTSDLLNHHLFDCGLRLHWA